MIERWVERGGRGRHGRGAVKPVTVAATLLAMVFLAAGAGAADDLESLQKENAELRQRVDSLSKEMEQIKELLTASGLPAPGKPAAGKAVTAKPFDLQLYGMIKLDAAHDDSQASIGNYARWVESEALVRNDGHFNMTANQTRLGLLVNGPTVAGLKTSGQVEIDFYGAGTAENKPEPLLRHAFAKADWTDWNFSLLAGQTADIISPLVAPTVNYTVAWWQGNLGYRRAQIRLTQGFKLAENWGLKLEAGATRTIADKLTGTPDTDPGADAEYPTAQSRVSLSFPVGGKRQGTFGVSGHYGIEERHESTTVTDREVVSWSVDADLRLPLAPWLLLQAEGFVGQDLSAYLGGIGQGYDATRREAVAALGGWTAVSLGPWGDWQFNLGAGIDKVDKDDVTANVDPAKDPRISNVVYFGNVYYTLTTNLQLALEISYLRTAYKSAALGDDWREQFSVIYKF